MAKKRTNVIPIIEDARHPAKYRMLVGMVDVIFSDVAQPDQVCSLCIFAFHNNLQTFIVFMLEVVVGLRKKIGSVIMWWNAGGGGVPSMVFSPYFV